MDLFFETAGRGPAFVVLHGLFGSSDNWRTVLRPLTQHFTVYFVDLRNHGRSPHDEVHDFPHMADDVIRLLDNEGIPQATIMGHSMGGKVAAHIAFTEPSRVERLLVVDIGLKESRPHHVTEFAALNAVQLNTLQTRQEADQAMLQAGLTDLSTRQFFAKNLYRPDETSFAWRFNLTGIQAQYEHILAAVGGPMDSYDGPTCYIRGAKSKYIKDEDVEAIELHFPDFRLVTIPDAGHWVHAEQPKLFLQAVADFMGVQV